MVEKPMALTVKDAKNMIHACDENNIKLFVSTSYLITTAMIIFLFKDRIGQNIYTIFLFIFILSLIYQLIKFKKK